MKTENQPVAATPISDGAMMMSRLVDRNTEVVEASISRMIERERNALVSAVLSWWASKSAETIIDSEGSEHGSVYADDPPEFVRLAMQLNGGKTK